MQFGQERTRLNADLAALEQLRGAERIAAEQAGARRAECEAIKASGEEINRKLALLDADTHVCPLCNCELGEHGVAHIQEEYDRERKELRGSGVGEPERPGRPPGLRRGSFLRQASGR